LVVVATRLGALDALACAIDAVFRAAVAVPFACLTAIVGNTAAPVVGPAKALAAAGISFALVACVGAFALLALAIERAALLVIFTFVAVEGTAGLDPDFIILCETELDAGQGGEGGNAPCQPFDRGPPVRLPGDRPRPVIEATVVHALSLLSSR
jgi:hypothetical protein